MGPRAGGAGGRDERVEAGRGRDMAYSHLPACLFGCIIIQPHGYMTTFLDTCLPIRLFNHCPVWLSFNVPILELNLCACLFLRARKAGSGKVRWRRLLLPPRVAR